MAINIIHDNAVTWARQYDGERFHSLLCDPPYALNFMNKKWDNGVAFDPATWYEFSKVLYPGAFGMAFASSRGWHRLAVAIEDAGFIIHPSIFGWAYGSGFPKATRVKGDDVFKGHRYGLQALKPALEPIIVFQKPYEGRPIDNITQYGGGALNIDGARITVDDDEPNRRHNPAVSHREIGEVFANSGFQAPQRGATLQQGRWPSNLILLDDEAAAALDRQSGVQKGGFVRNRTDGARVFNNNGQSTGYRTDEIIDEPDGGASRFFFRVQDAIDSADPVYYEAKASTEERDAGIDSGVILPNAGKRTMSGGEDTRGRPEAMVRNPHPTVKPIALARYLATLLLPPTEYAPRRLFIPFAGVASECIGSMQAGWDDIIGVELTPEYIPIANARIEYWRNRGWQLSMFSEILTQENANV